MSTHPDALPGPLPDDVVTRSAGGAPARLVIGYADVRSDDGTRLRDFLERVL